MSRESLVLQSFLTGGLFMLFMGVRDLGRPDFHQAGIALIVLGCAFAVSGYLGLRVRSKGIR